MVCGTYLFGYENKVKANLKIQNRNLHDYIFDIVVPMEEDRSRMEEKGHPEEGISGLCPGKDDHDRSWYAVKIPGAAALGTRIVPCRREVRNMGGRVRACSTMKSMTVSG